MIEKRCPDCGVNVGQIHETGCDIPHCQICGNQLLQCKHLHGNSVWSGVVGLELKIIAYAMGLYVRDTGIGWQKTTKDDPKATYDLNSAYPIYRDAVRALQNELVIE